MAKDANENVWVHDYAGGNLYLWTQLTNTWSIIGNIGVANYETPWACDTKRNRIFRTYGGGSSPGPGYLDLTNPTAGFTNVTLTGTYAHSITAGNVVYDPVVDCFWFWRRGDPNNSASNWLYQIDPTTWAVTVATVTGSMPDNTYVDGTTCFYGRFNYCPELNGLVFMKNSQTNVYFIRTG